VISEAEANDLTARTAAHAEELLSEFSGLHTKYGLDLGASTFKSHRLGRLSWGKEERGLYAFLLVGVTPRESFEAVVIRPTSIREWQLIQTPEEARDKMFKVLTSWNLDLKARGQ
jgi:hypothetical protein